jgi:cell division protein FtsW
MTILESRPRHVSRPERLTTIPGRDTSNYWWLLAVLAVLNIVGLVMVLSASSVVSLRETGSSWTYFTKQAEWMVLGIMAAFAMIHLDLDRLRRSAPLWLGLCCLGLLAVHVPGLGVTANGATRWIALGPIQIQPSEITKLVLLVFVADWLDRQQAHIQVARVSVRPVMLVLGVVAALVMAQPNLGTTLVIAAIVFAILFAAGAPRGALCAWGVAGTAAAIALALGSSYRRARVLSFLNPWADPQHNGYQLIQSRVGLAGGGVFGVGLGASRAKWGFLPFAHTDFIFSIIGEELGLVGAVVVVGLFIAFGVLGMRVAHQAKSRFQALVAVGVTTWIVVQAFVNIGAVIGILPITGVPLPFISYGGTSLLVTLAAAGMLLNVARHPAPAPARR